MKAKVYFFRLIIGFLAFCLGLGIYWTIRGFESVETEYPTCLNYPTENVNAVKEDLPLDNPITVTDTKAIENVEKEDEFYAGGDYYLIGDSPKDFKDFESLSISTDDWNDKLNQLVPIPPKGSLFMKKEHKFSTVAINNRWLSFKTEKINGVHYGFIGNYPKEEILVNGGEEYVYLQGRLIKFKDGKKVAEIEAKFGAIDGC